MVHASWRALGAWLVAWLVAWRVAWRVLLFRTCYHALVTFIITTRCSKVLELVQAQLLRASSSRRKGEYYPGLHPRAAALLETQR